MLSITGVVCATGAFLSPVLFGNPFSDALLSGLSVGFCLAAFRIAPAGHRAPAITSLAASLFIVGYMIYTTIKYLGK